MTRRRNHQHVAEAFEVALADGDDTHAEFGPLVRLSTALQPAKPLNQTNRAQTKDMMLRAFDVAQNAASAPVLTEPAYDAPVPVGQPPAVYTATVVLPDGGAIYMADVEPISEGRAAEAAQTVLARDHSRRA